MTSQTTIERLLGICRDLVDQEEALFEISSHKPIVEQIRQLKDDNSQIGSLLPNFNHTIEKLFNGGSLQEFSKFCTVNGQKLMEKKYSGWLAQEIITMRNDQCDFITFQEDVRPDGRWAMAYTYEKWTFSFKSGETRSTNGGIDAYRLAFQDGVWKVDHVETFSRAAA